MDRKLVSAEDHEIEYLARKHGTTKDKVLEIAHATGSRSREQIEAALDKQFKHVDGSRKSPACRKQLGGIPYGYRNENTRSARRQCCGDHVLPIRSLARRIGKASVAFDPDAPPDCATGGVPAVAFASRSASLARSAPSLK